MADHPSLLVGLVMVTIFFVTGGYVLSYKPLQAMRTDNMNELQRLRSTSVFQRIFRLLCPTVMAVFLWATLAHLGVFQAAAQIYHHDDRNFVYLTTRYREPPRRQPSFGAQMIDMLINLPPLLNVWEWYDNTASAGHYDPHTWTIPVEIRASMMLFLTLTGTAHMHRLSRTLCVSGLMAFCIFSDQIEATLLLAGMLLAERDISQQEHNPKSGQDTKLSGSANHTSRISRTTWLLVFVAALYLASTPIYGCAGSAGYRALYDLSPRTISDRTWFLRSIGAVCMTWCATNPHRLRTCFVNRISLYIGEISFAFYLVHGNVLKGVGYVLMPRIYAVVGIDDVRKATTMQLIAAWFGGVVVLLPLTIWAANLFSRSVHVPCARFVRCLTKSAMRKSEMEKR